MPPPRKIDLIPQEIRLRLQDLLKARGFSDYVAVTEDLNFWLEEAGLEMRVGNRRSIPLARNTSRWRGPKKKHPLGP